MFLYIICINFFISSDLKTKLRHAILSTLLYLLLVQNNIFNTTITNFISSYLGVFLVNYFEREKKNRGRGEKEGMRES